MQDVKPTQFLSIYLRGKVIVQDIVQFSHFDMWNETLRSPLLQFYKPVNRKRDKKQTNKQKEPKKPTKKNQKKPHQNKTKPLLII